MLFFKVFLFILCFSVSSVAQPYDAIINLGGDCQVAYQLYTQKLRQYALPFDTLIAPYESLRGMLQNNFEGLMARDNFAFVVTPKGGKYILDKKYVSRWIHCFALQEDFLKNYEEIATTYLRRIDRLLSLITTSEYPIFIRKIITQEQAIELRNILFTMRRGKPFLLLALDGTPEMQSDWQLEGIRNYYLRQPQPYTWKGDLEAWKEIFRALGMI